MWRCKKCGAIKTEMPNEMDEQLCTCGGQYEKAKQCEVCGKWFFSESLLGFGDNVVCANCFEGNIGDEGILCVDNIFAYAKENGLESELTEHIKRFVTNGDVFAEWFVRGLKEC